MEINFEEVNSKNEWLAALNIGYMESFKLRHKNIKLRGFPIITKETRNRYWLRYWLSFLSLKKQ